MSMLQSYRNWLRLRRLNRWVKHNPLLTKEQKDNFRTEWKALTSSQQRPK